MLKRPLPGRSRRLVGLTAIVGFTAVASYVAWAGQSATDKGPPILVDLKLDDLRVGVSCHPIDRISL